MKKVSQFQFGTQSFQVGIDLYAWLYYLPGFPPHNREAADLASHSREGIWTADLQPSETKARKRSKKEKLFSYAALTQ